MESAMSTHWPLELRERCTQRLLDPNPPTMAFLSQETGVPAPTLWRWKEGALRGRVPRGTTMASNKDNRPQRWPPAERLRVVVETASLEEAELGEYLRRVGLHAATVEGWRADALAGLGGQVAPSGKPRVSRRERELQRELRRKEKALAETAALLVLQKKAHLLLGEDEDGS